MQPFWALLGVGLFVISARADQVLNDDGYFYKKASANANSKVYVQAQSDDGYHLGRANEQANSFAFAKAQAQAPVRQFAQADSFDVVNSAAAVNSLRGFAQHNEVQSQGSPFFQSQPKANVFLSGNVPAAGSGFVAAPAYVNQLESFDEYSGKPQLQQVESYLVNCIGNGQICVPRNLCVDGYVHESSVAKFRDASQECNLQREVCCKVKEFQVNTLVSSNVELASGGYEYNQAKLFNAEESNNGYLPPLGSAPSSNVPAFSNPPEAPQKEVEGESSDNSESVALPAEAPAEHIQLGCAAALVCVEEKFCDMQGVITKEAQSLTPAQLLRRVPLNSCRNPENGVVGKCCRDPDYVDPWPTGNLPANYSGGFDEQGFPTFLNIAKTRPPKPVTPPRLVPKPQPEPEEDEIISEDNSASNLSPQAVYLPVLKPTTSPPPPPPVVYVPVTAAPSNPSKNVYLPPVSRPTTTTTPPPPPPPKVYVPVTAAPSNPSKNVYLPPVSRPTTTTTPPPPPPPKVYVPVTAAPSNPSKNVYLPPKYVQPTPAPTKPPVIYLPSANVQIPVNPPKKIEVPVKPFVPAPAPPKNVYLPAKPQFPTTTSAPIKNIDLPSKNVITLITPNKPTKNVYLPPKPVAPAPVPPPKPVIPAPNTPPKNVYLPVKQVFPEPQKDYLPAKQTPTPVKTVVKDTIKNYTISTSANNQVYIKPHVPGRQCGLRNEVNRVSGLQPDDVAFGEIPWQAMILSNPEKKLLCSGVIVAPNVVLTAAHCIEGYLAADVSIKAGEWKLGYNLKWEEPLDFEIVQVADIVPHPKWYPNSPSYDLAVLYLQHDIHYDQHIDEVCLGDGFVSVPKNNCFATGWGKIVLQVNKEGALMHSVDIDILSHEACRERLLNAETQLEIDETMVCGKAHKQRNNVCQVDLGGPLVCDRGDGFYELVGVYNQDTGCLPTNQVATFSLIDNEWVRKMIKSPPTVLQGPEIVEHTQNEHTHHVQEAATDVKCDCQKSNLPPGSNQYLPPAL